MSKKAFTLIELLVVIAIIALLVSILLPSLNKARDMAKGTVCMSNLKNLGIGINLYLEDSGGILPKGSVGNGLSYYDCIHWLVVDLDPYMGNENSVYNWGTQAYPNPNKVWQCPSENLSDYTGFEAQWHGSSYDYTWQYGGQKIENEVRSYMGESWTWVLEPAVPAEAPLMYDLLGVHTETLRFNVLYADTHVTMESPDMADWMPFRYF